MNVVIGISGGVDSAVAALRLKQAGHDVTGVFMKNWEEDDTQEHCTAEEDLKMARAVCERLDIPLKTVNFSAEYWDRVFEYFLAEYRAGRTPNPDVLCNREIKFKAFLDHALTLGAERIATGHYARIAGSRHGWRLLKAADTAKDQTYFLCLLGQKELAHTLFPIGDLLKEDVRRLAQASGLPNADRHDSTGICFIGERDFKSFLEHYLPAQRGELRALSGEIKGRHDGAMYYTIGQRQGLGIGGEGAAWYVVEKDVAKNIVYVAQGENHPALFRDSLVAGQVHWVGTPPALPARLTARIRYRQSEQPCTVSVDRDGLRVVFNAPQRAVTPGQMVVFYSSDQCLGGGVIEYASATDNHSTILRRAVKP